MLKYSVKRLLQSFVTIFIVVSIVFLLLRLMPISGYFEPGTWDKMSWETKVNYLRKLGIFDEHGREINPFVQLFNFYQRMFTTFDFGESTRIQQGIKVTKILADKMPYSFAFGLASTIFSLLIGYPIGILMARYKDRAFDRLFMIYIIIFAAIPGIIYFFILQNYITKWTGWPMIFKKERFDSWFTPVIISVLAGVTGPALWLRRYTVDQLNADYVKLARAKGLPSMKVMFGHIMRNAFVPMAYGLPAALLFTIGGSILIESLFAIPGMGGLLIKAVQQKDNNLVQVIVFIFSSLGVIGVFLGDILAALVDPRIRLASKGGVR